MIFKVSDRGVFDLVKFTIGLDLCLYYWKLPVLNGFVEV